MTTTQQLSTKEDILHYLLKQGQATAQELAEVLSVSPQAIRRHLKDLETETLILYQSVQGGMGRPQHVYTLSREGRSRFPNSYDKLAVSLLQTMQETLTPDQFGAVLHNHWHRKAIDYRQAIGEGPLPDRLTNFVTLRQNEGFMSEWQVLETTPDRPVVAPPTYLLADYHCAITEVAEAFPRVCGHELDLFVTVFADCHVERTHWLIKGETHCGYLIQEHPPQERLPPQAPVNFAG
jgi:DeoR family transcriptional regulator, suf operon transcriptional repressor